MKVELLTHTRSRELISALPVSEIPEKELLQHIGFTFALEGMSRACSHQLVRHRDASFSQQSQRYITVKRLRERVVIPPSIAEKGRDEFDSFIAGASEAYQKMVDNGVPKEDARFVLPNATETSLLMTLDGRSLIHLFGLRLCTRAQWEIRGMVEEMLRQVKEAEPVLFASAGPYCVQLGRCPEGRFSCGRMEEMKKIYAPSP